MVMPVVVAAASLVRLTSQGNPQHVVLILGYVGIPTGTFLIFLKFFPQQKSNEFPSNHSQLMAGNLQTIMNLQILAQILFNVPICIGTVNPKQKQAPAVYLTRHLLDKAVSARKHRRAKKMNKTQRQLCDFYNSSFFPSFLCLSRLCACDWASLCSTEPQSTVCLLFLRQHTRARHGLAHTIAAKNH